MCPPKTSRSRKFVAFVLGLFVFASLSSFAGDDVSTSNGSLRMQRPLFVGFGIGTPAPAWVGTSLGFQYRDDSQLVVSYGRFWADDLTIHSLEAALRIQLLPTAFTPVIGGGINSLFFKGQGTLQTLHETSLLVSLFLGLDWTMPDGFRITSGVNLHVPLRLNFPMLSVGWSL